MNALRTRLKECLGGAHDVRVIALGVERAKATSAALVQHHRPSRSRYAHAPGKGGGYGRESASRLSGQWTGRGCARRETHAQAAGAAGRQAGRQRARDLRSESMESLRTARVSTRRAGMARRSRARARVGREGERSVEHAAPGPGASFSPPSPSASFSPSPDLLSSFGARQS
jgi:hypothetical protein